MDNLLPAMFTPLRFSQGFYRLGLDLSSVTSTQEGVAEITVIGGRNGA
jgi:hypothetical protein